MGKTSITHDKFDGWCGIMSSAPCIDTAGFRLGFMKNSKRGRIFFLAGRTSRPDLRHHRITCARGQYRSPVTLPRNDRVTSWGLPTRTTTLMKSTMARAVNQTCIVGPNPRVQHRGHRNGIHKTMLHRCLASNPAGAPRPQRGVLRLP